MIESPASTLDLLGAVRERYAQGVRATVPELCCPVDKDSALLEAEIGDSPPAPRRSHRDR